MGNVYLGNSESKMKIEIPLCKKLRFKKNYARFLKMKKVKNIEKEILFSLNEYNFPKVNNLTKFSKTQILSYFILDAQ